MNRRTNATRIVPAILALAPLAAAGCYQRTVEAKGLGAEYREGQIYEPNLKTRQQGGGFFGDGLLGPREFREQAE